MYKHALVLPNLALDVYSVYVFQTQYRDLICDAGNARRQSVVMEQSRWHLLRLAHAVASGRHFISSEKSVYLINALMISAPAPLA